MPVDPDSILVPIEHVEAGVVTLPWAYGPEAQQRVAFSDYGTPRQRAFFEIPFGQLDGECWLCAREAPCGCLNGCQCTCGGCAP